MSDETMDNELLRKKHSLSENERGRLWFLLRQMIFRMTPSKLTTIGQRVRDD